jgi:mono/diheme cytochrome c family protein
MFMTRGGKFYLTWLAALAVAGCLYGLAGTGGLAAAGQQGKARRPARPPARVRSLFKQHCSRCHRMDGAGGTLMGELMNVPNFTYAWWHETTSDERMINSITRGRRQMPAFGEKLSRSEIKSLVGFVRRFKQ